MKVAPILLGVVLLLIFDVSSADHHNGPQLQHHVVKHVTTGAHDLDKKVSKQNKHFKKTGRRAFHDEEIASSGNSGKVHHRIDEAEDAGRKNKNYAQAGHQVHKKSGEQSEHGGQFKLGDAHKKTTISKGYREKYHKDERKKHDSYFSEGHKSGDYKLFGSKSNKHHSHHHDKDVRGKHVEGKFADKHAKDKKSAHGHVEAEQNGHRNEQGVKSHYNKATKWGKKNHHNHQDQFKYAPLK